MKGERPVFQENQIRMAAKTDTKDQEVLSPEAEAPAKKNNLRAETSRLEAPCLATPAKSQATDLKT